MCRLHYLQAYRQLAAARAARLPQPLSASPEEWALRGLAILPARPRHRPLVDWQFNGAKGWGQQWTAPPVRPREGPTDDSLAHASGAAGRQAGGGQVL